MHRYGIGDAEFPNFISKLKAVQTKNAGQVALEMGNSPAVVMKHYFEIVDARAAREYWSIKLLPATDRKIVTIALPR